MKIYHYTTIETLALILQNKTLRFNRLDQVDDLEEGSVESSGVKLGKYVFVSCWTENKEESVPLWKMYTDNGVGVRIALEQDMFKDFPTPNGLAQNNKDLYLKIPMSELFNPDYMMLLTFKIHDRFYRKIEYVDNVFEKTKDAVNIDVKSNDTSDMLLKFNEIGRFKNNRWAFQDESRFYLNILPKNPQISTGDDAFASWLYHAVKDGIELPMSDYYMHLKENVFDSMEITLSPSMPMAKRIIVEALRDKYAPNASISKSILEQSVKLK